MKKPHNQTTILLIENDSDWLVDVYSTLQEAGYDVLIATGGDEGFCVARRVRPDLIVCEAALPDISGVQLCYMIRADKDLKRSLFVLMGGADGQDCDTAVEALRAGADDFFERNSNRHFLAAKISRLVALRRTEAELRQRCRNLRRSETHLSEIIEDAAKLVAVIEPVSKPASSNGYNVQESKKFFGKSAEPENSDRKKSVETLETWRRSLQPRESVQTNKTSNDRREKVYYEIVC